jgi:hypothetical protein
MSDAASWTPASPSSALSGNSEGPFDVTDCRIGHAGQPRMLNDLALTISDVLAEGDDPSPMRWVNRPANER